MPRIKPTERDFKNQYAPCLECADYGVLLDAGTEAEYRRCDRCGSNDVILIKQFKSNET